MLYAIKKANHRAAILNGMKIKNDERSRVAAALFAIAQQHHNSILILLKNEAALYASAFALLRPLLEVTIRGIWVLHCAKEEDIKLIVEGHNSKWQKKTTEMLDDIDKQNGYESKEVFYPKLFKVLSAYTHGYEQQIQRWLKTNDIEAGYSNEEISELIEKSDFIANIVFVSTQSLVVDEAD